MGTLSDVLIVTASSGALAQLISVTWAALRHAAAERALMRRMKNQQDLVQQLEELRRALEESAPTSETVTEARQILAPVVDSLSKKYRSDILNTLEQGSDKSRANYIAKLLRQAKSAQTA